VQEGGQRVDREEFIRHHAKWSRQLREFFDNEDAIGAGLDRSAAEETKPFAGEGVSHPKNVPGFASPAAEPTLSLHEIDAEADGPEDAALAPGKSIGRYCIERLLGVG
jgi:hypothetical protein